MWPYAWILPVTVGSISIATNILLAGHAVIGWLLIAAALFVLLVAVLHDYVTRFDRRHAYYSVNGDQVSRQFTLPRYMALPEAARFKLLDEVPVGRWVARTTDAYARRVFVDFERPGGEWIYRLRNWYLNFLRND